jgi:hypothetical protein
LRLGHFITSVTRLCLPTILIATAGCAGTAQAAKFLDGPYGSKEGCIYAKTSESSGAEDFLLLTDAQLTTAFSFCEFKGAATRTKDGFTIRAQCDAEGETGPEQTATLRKSANGYTVSFPDGTTMGPMPKCR